MNTLHTAATETAGIMVRYCLAWMLFCRTKG